MVLLCILDLLKTAVQVTSHSLPVLLPYLWQQESLAEGPSWGENCNTHCDVSLLRYCEIPPFGPNCQLLSIGFPLNSCGMELLWTRGQSLTASQERRFQAPANSLGVDGIKRCQTVLVNGEMMSGDTWCWSVMWALSEGWHFPKNVDKSRCFPWMLTNLEMGPRNQIS